MRIVYYYRHLNDPIGSGSHATSLVREWTKAGNEVALPPAAARRPAVWRTGPRRRASRLLAARAVGRCGTGCAICRTA